MLKSQSRIWPWLLVWGILDLLCALFCEIHADEAYYRLYGQFLDWGYFDHPPMVGLMTALSGAIVPTTSLMLKNLSVRLVTVLMHVATVYIVWKTIEKPSISNQQSSITNYLLVAASIPMFCAYGFITTPDAPLLFFAALFYYAYRKYLTDRSWPTTILLGVSMAGMLYSKYIAILVLVFAVMANWKLLREGRFWAAVGIAALLLAPHLWWQYSNGFPSMVHQWTDRLVSYKWTYTLEYFPNQWAVFNPLIWALMIWFGWKQLRAQDSFYRALGWTIIGFQVFFLLMTVRGHVEPHWTVVSTIPAIILLTEDWNQSENTLFQFKGVRITLYTFVAVVLIARIVLMLNILPMKTGLANKQPYYASLHEEAQGRPIIFDGSFQRASLYRFFYDDQAVRVRNMYDRYNQYDLLHLEKDLMGKPVCIMRHNQIIMVDCLKEEDLYE